MFMLSLEGNKRIDFFLAKKNKTAKIMYLLRKKHPNKDKENNWVETFEQALALIGQTDQNIKN